MNYEKEIRARFIKPFGSYPPPEDITLVCELGERADKEIEILKDILVCVTHHEGALEECRERWLPIVQKELERRAKLHRVDCDGVGDNNGFFES